MVIVNLIMKNFYNLKKKLYKLRSIKKIQKLEFSESITLNKVWFMKNCNNYIFHNDNTIFGKSLDLKNINWHKDYLSGFEYPLKRFDKIKITKLYNKGIEIKFPWELSRFHFGVSLAMNYLITNKEMFYIEFTELIQNWINKNPFLYGINWYCTMEVAIRAINWIVAVNLFGKLFFKDIKFQKRIISSLIQHVEYISLFPEIDNHGHTTNHTTADYTGLLFLATALQGHPKSEKWLTQSLEGLEKCIRHQTYEDGVNIEGSIPYHRLVLEMFAYSAIVARANNINFSQKYYELLFKMFEYAAAYMDHNGNAPQVGDNDSGRILVLHESDEHDHSYLLDLGEHIFEYTFKSQCIKRNVKFSQMLPENDKIEVIKR